MSHFDFDNLIMYDYDGLLLYNIYLPAIEVSNYFQIWPIHILIWQYQGLCGRQRDQATPRASSLKGRKPSEA